MEIIMAIYSFPFVSSPQPRKARMRNKYKNPNSKKMGKFQTNTDKKNKTLMDMNRNIPYCLRIKITRLYPD
jgi:hypothetical protein